MVETLRSGRVVETLRKIDEKLSGWECYSPHARFFICVTGVPSIHLVTLNLARKILIWQAALAQSVERLTRNEKVEGSIPSGGSHRKARHYNEK